MKIELVIPGVPCGQPRVRATVRNGHAGVYSPTTIRDSLGHRKPHPAAVFKAAIQAAWGTGRVATGEPVTMLIDAVFQRPSTKRWKSKAMPTYPHQGKPDHDNISKAICDALNKLAYHDDSQVWLCTITKRVAAGDEAPHTRIVIEF